MGERKKLWDPLKDTNDFENAHFPEVGDRELHVYRL